MVFIKRKVNEMKEKNCKGRKLAWQTIRRMTRVINSTVSINLREREREIDQGAGAKVPREADSGLACG